MIMKQKQRISLLTIGIILASFIGVFNSTYGQEQEEPLRWSMETNKSEFYPGEPVLLTLNIRNMRAQEEKIYFGMDGIEAFSFEIHDSNGITVAKGGKIQKFGVSRVGTLSAPPGKIAQKSIVLNRWCSTLLSPGEYEVICNIDYRLRSESKKIKNTNGFKAGPVHSLQIKVDMCIIDLDTDKFKQILTSLIKTEIKQKEQSNREWWENLKISRELLAFTESKIAVPYQLKLLEVEKYTWLKRDIVNSLVKSGALEAADGLIKIIEDPSIYKEDVKGILIEGVYRLRETGKTDIINATEEFVEKYQRPAPSIGPPID
ncbi:MAG: hypothetical protein JXB29_07970 [Sedimentisphaerales bacterium]|nr:hypothetical protein [Sedimentisphaerales bacterium]